MLAGLRRRARSVSFRAGLWSALSVGAVASLAAFVVVSLVFVLFVVTGGITQTSLIDRAEDQLLLGVGPEDLRLPTIDELATADRPNADPVDDTAFWAILDDADVVVRSEGEIDADVLAAPFSDPGFGVQIESDSSGDDLDGLKRVDGQDWYYVERAVTAPDGRTFRVITADGGTFSLRGFLWDSLPVTVPVVLLLMGVAMAITSYVTRRALRRVERIRTEVEQITRQSLDRRVPTVDASDGIERLATTMNDMLARLEAADAKQSRFLADASHELRSPVAGLLAQLDVAAAYPDRFDAETVLPRLHDDVQRLQRLVDDLLFLGRLEAGGRAGVEREAWNVDVDELVATEVAHQRLLDPEITIETLGDTGASVSGNGRDLGRALRNLLGNATRHGNERVEVRVEVSGPDVLITVADDGTGVPSDVADRIFDRFVRADDSRSRDGGGAGLGLALVQEIAVAHGGRIELLGPRDDRSDSSCLSGARFRLSLPLAAPVSRSPG